MAPSSHGNQTYISKSRYLDGLQCLKLLWFRYNRKDLIPPIDASTQAIFDQGHLVGEYAKRLFSAGIEIKRQYTDIPGIIEDSTKALNLRKPIFEAGFQFNGGFSRADVLNPVTNDQWDLIEVKSSTEVKDVNLQDAAFQKYVYQNSGIAIRKVYLYCIDNQYERHGDIEPAKLFASHNITRDAGELIQEIPSNLRAMHDCIQQGKFPDIRIGPHCNHPYGCPLIELCWGFLPPHNVTSLYRGGQKAFELLEAGTAAIRDIPPSVHLTANQQIQKDAVCSGKPHVDKKAISEFLDTLEYPLYYFDFETFATAIPLYDNVRPYLKVPFQYSLHVQRKPGSDLEHHSYLAPGDRDPRPDILANLQKLLGTKGSIVAYSDSFERGVLRSCAEFYPAYAKWVASLEPRFVDLLVPFRSFYYYHSDQNGSASIKAVLPALTGSGYEGMDIHEGEMASREYLRVTFGEVDEKVRTKVRKQLEEYCKLDTQAMIDIVSALRSIVR